jgi:hypothetical protein
VPPIGDVVTLAGTGNTGSTDGPGATADLQWPVALAARPDGSLLFVQSASGLIRRIADDKDHMVSTYAGKMGRLGSADGKADLARVFSTIAVATRANGDLVTVDNGTWRLRIVEAGNVKTLVGGGAIDLNGPGESAQLWAPCGVTSANDDSLWVIEHGGAVRRVVLQ